MTVVTTTTTASSVPTMAERTGTALRPPPESTANRMPSTEGAGSPALTAVRTSGGTRFGRASRDETR